MESRAVAKYIHQSPFKIRKTLDSVRGMSVDKALNHLHFSPEKAAKVIEKTIRSAVSNILNQNDLKICTDAIYDVIKLIPEAGASTFSRFCK